MKKELAIKKINGILDEVASSWLANDGGLTLAASDILAFGRGVIADIEAGRAERLWPEPLFNRDSGEVEILAIAQQWAKGKIRRQVEDRLRKDAGFFEGVANWHLGVDCCSHCGRPFGYCGQYSASFPTETGDTLCFGCAAHFCKEEFIKYIQKYIV